MGWIIAAVVLGVVAVLAWRGRNSRSNVDHARLRHQQKLDFGRRFYPGG